MNELVNGYFLYYITDVSWRGFRGGAGAPPLKGGLTFIIDCDQIAANVMLKFRASYVSFLELAPSHVVTVPDISHPGNRG